MSELQQISELSQAYNEGVMFATQTLLILGSALIVFQIMVRAIVSEARKPLSSLPRYRWLRRWWIAQRIQVIRSRQRAEREQRHIRRVARRERGL